MQQFSLLLAGYPHYNVEYERITMIAYINILKEGIALRILRAIDRFAQLRYQQSSLASLLITGSRLMQLPLNRLLLTFCRVAPGIVPPSPHLV